MDVVVNAAGILAVSLIAEFDLDTFDRIMRTNVRGTFIVNQQAARRVRSGGAIINFSTTVTRTLLPGYGPYAASKGAVDVLSQILARELRGRDITANAIPPGPTAAELFFEGKDDALIERLAKMNRWSDWARPTISPKSWRSWPARRAGSTARSSTPTAAWPSSATAWKHNNAAAQKPVGRVVD